MYHDLPEFLSELEDDGELVRISVEADPVLEIAEITNRACQSPGGGPALFFENVKGHSIPIVTNLLGNRVRISKALRTNSFDDVASRIAGLIQPELPDGWLETLKLIPHFSQLTKLPPKTVDTGVCQQVVHMGSDVDLNMLPIPHIWPGDSGPAITAGQVYTQHPTSSVRNVGLYPLTVRDRTSLSIHWHAQQDGWSHLEECRRHGRQQMPIAVALGGDPVYTYMAHAPLPPNTDECLLGGFLRSQNVELVRCRSIDLEVPAQAEIVIEGHIDVTAELESAGPLGTSTGFYSPAAELPTMHVTAITQRSNPVFPAMILGKHPVEEFWLNRATERIFLPLVKLFVPELVDLHQPPAGNFRNLLFVSIRKQYPQQARKVMHALWSFGRLAVSKIIVVVDEDVDVQDENQVWFTVGSHTHPGRDVLFCEGPAHPLDHAAPVAGMGHKMGIDATRKLPDEGHPRPWPETLSMPADISELVTNRWSEYGFTGKHVAPTEQASTVSR